ncbi:MAG: flagellar basal body P-ring protein FlgI [Sneathiellaceae bacterium]
MTRIAHRPAAPATGSAGLRLALGGLIGGLVLLALAMPVQAATTRIKDIADFDGIRENMLIGYGLVVGLNGSGDSLRNAPFTRQSLENMLERMGVNIRGNTNFQTDNTATVMVTANLPPFARNGQRIDINVASLGDADSLMGGNLLVTPLIGADGEVYAVAQGPVTVGGFSAQGQGQTVTQNVPTAGRIPNGAIVEREVGFDLASLPSLRLALRNPDLTTARRIAQAVNGALAGANARALDPSTVALEVPPGGRTDMVGMMVAIEQLQVTTDTPAKVVVNEATGVIVMGNAVRIDTVAIAQGNLTIRITETPQVSQPNAFAPGPGVVQGIGGIQGVAETTGTVQVPRTNPDGSPARDTAGNVIFDPVTQAVPGTGLDAIQPQQGLIAGGATTVVVPRTQIDITQDGKDKLTVVNGGVSLQQLVDGLNALGVGPRDMISILEAIKAAGALQADIEVI